MANKTTSKQRFGLRVLRLHHRHAWRHAFRQITKNPFASILTIAVISITLVLPTGLLLLLNNAETATMNWNKGTNISVYLHSGATPQQISFVRQAINNIPNIQNVAYITPEQGLLQFGQQTGLSDLINTLGDNPLPGVFKITPINQSPAAINILKSQLSAIGNIDSVKLDMQWVMRLNAMLEFLRDFTYGIAIILAIAVLLIVGNTIRMNIQSYQQEIEVMKLVGASKAFIRRPFLYSGILYGTFAAVFTAIVLDFFLLWLKAPLNQLISLYQNQFSLQSLNLLQTIELLAIGIILGYLGSWLVVDKYLRKIRPD